MEIPPSNDNKTKKNIKALPATINIGAGGLGIGGVLLLGGALVTATIVSALAFRSRSQRRSTSENTKKMSPSTETRSVGSPNKLELMMNTDLSPSSDEVTSMRKIQAKNSQCLTPDKKHDEQVHSGDSNEQIIDSVVVEDQENTLIRVDSVFENKEQVVQIKEDSFLEIDDDGGEEQKDLIDNENKEHVDANSLASDEGAVSIEEYEAIEVPLKDTVAEESKDEDHEETVLLNAAASMEPACINQIKVEGNLYDEIILENCVGDLSDDTGYADQIVHEVVTEEEEEEEASDAARVLQIEEQNCQLLVGQDEVVMENCGRDLSNKKSPANQIIGDDAQQMQGNQNLETFVVAYVMNRLMEAADDQTAANKDTPTSGSMNKEGEDKDTTQMVEEHVTRDDEPAKLNDQTDIAPKILMNKEKKDAEGAVQVKVEMLTEHELVRKDEISHVEPTKEDEDCVKDITVKAELSSGVSSSYLQEELTPKATIRNDKPEETEVQVKLELITDHDLVKKEEISPAEFVRKDEDNVEDVKVKAELSSTVEEEPTPETKISKHKTQENMKENQTILSKNNEEDFTVKAELSFVVRSPFLQEEPTPETKISNHKIDDNMDENQTILGKNHNDSEEDVTIKTKLASGVSAMQEEATPEGKIQENMEENQTIFGKNHNDSYDNRVIKEVAFASEPRNLKLMAWSILISVWCLYHWYSELPFRELSLIGSLFFILIVFGYRYTIP